MTSRPLCCSKKLLLKDGPPISLELMLLGKTSGVITTGLPSKDLLTNRPSLVLLMIQLSLRLTLTPLKPKIGSLLTIMSRAQQALLTLTLTLMGLFGAFAKVLMSHGKELTMV